MERAQAGETHEPLVKDGDVGISDEGLRVRTEKLRVEIWQHAHGTVAPRSVKFAARRSSSARW
jgi:hypothetical protein